MSKVCLMRAEYSTPSENYASEKLRNNGNILPGESGKVGASMRRRQTPGEVLARNMKESGGISVPEIVRRAAAKGYDISPNTINYILRGATKNPGIFTIEAIAVALDKAPEQLTAEFLGVRSDDPGFKASQYAMLNEIHKSMTPTQKQRAEPHTEAYLLILQHIKSQK